MRLALVLFLACTLHGQTLDGPWQGSIDAAAMKLRIVLHLAGTSGKLDSLDQGQNGLPIESIALKGKAVTLTMDSLQASYSGTLSTDGNRIDGTWKQGGLALPAAFNRGERVEELIRPQNPKKPYPYAEEEVTVENAAAKVKLAGTLTIPAGKGPFPAVVLITGSGPQDRDETLMGHRPFLVIADHLTRNGVAVLRVDDRGTAKSTGDFQKATTADFATDTIACIRFLKARHDIDGAKIGLVGHSEGAVIAPIVASRGNDAGFVVLMAGTGVPGTEVLVEQQALISKAMGMPGSLEAENRQRQEKVVAILRDETDTAVAKRKIDALYKPQIDAAPVAQRAAAQAMLDAQIGQFVSPWFRYFLQYDPAPALRMLHCPALVLNGALDLQVSANQNLPVIAKALEDAANMDYEIVKFPHLNHLFQTAVTGAPAEYANITETISPTVLDVMTQWILRHVKSN